MGRIAIALVVVLGTACGRFAFDPTSRGDGGGDGDARTGDGAADDSRSGDGSLDARTDWWDSRWQKRIKLVLGDPVTDLLGFPLLVRLTPARIDYADTQDQGQDLRFVDADGVTVLPHDIEQWIETGVSTVWVRVPEVDSGAIDHLWLYYGNNTAASTVNSQAVWSGYSLVWHLEDLPNGAAPQIRDRTANGNHGTSAGGMSAAAQNTGMVGGSLAFDGIDDWIAAPNSPSLELTGNVTISTWVMKAATAREEWLVDFVTQQSESEANNHLYELSIDVSNNVELEWEYNAGSGEAVQSSTPHATGTGTWMLLTMTRDSVANQVRFYENGAILGTARPYTNDATGGTTSSLFVGGQVDPSSSKMPLQGRLDELRIEPEVRTPAWIDAQNQSMRDLFVTYAAPESY